MYTIYIYNNKVLDPKSGCVEGGGSGSNHAPLGTCNSLVGLFYFSNGFNILLYGLGSKRNLIEDFRTTMLKDFSHVVVNGYFPSLTVKHVSTVKPV